MTENKPGMHMSFTGSTLRRRSSTHLSKMKSNLQGFVSKSDASFRQLRRQSSSHQVGCGTGCRADYVTSRGKWIQVWKLMGIIAIPILAAWSFSVVSLLASINTKQDFVESRETMYKAVSLGRLINSLQKERDMSLMHVSSLVPATKSFLYKAYDETDEIFAHLWNWPSEFQNIEQDIFRSKSKLLAYIKEFRNSLNSDNEDMSSVIIFYSEIVEFFMDWMITRIKESGFGDNWKTLVAFQKITSCMLHAGAERAYGSLYFAEGLSVNSFDNYLRRVNSYTSQFKGAAYYSVLIDTSPDSESNLWNVSEAIKQMRSIIYYSNMSFFKPNETSKQASNSAEAKSRMAEFYFDNMTLRVNHLYKLQEMLANRIIELITEKISGVTKELAAYGVTLTLVILSFPLIFSLIESLTSNMQSYSKILVKASNDLNTEKDKTNSLLYRMLPKPVAERLKSKCKVESEFFRTATILFTSTCIVDFSKIGLSSSALELVDLLNTLYTSIDEHLDKYDVYKVETINDTYMVASGVPVKNGNRHTCSSEIAYLALDLVHVVRHKIFMPRSKQPIQLLLGINTGSVSAGIVGTVMLRYCLFGDTVNIASRMKSYSAPNRIHISESTQTHLKTVGSFYIKERGLLEIKGKGQMRTYWLVDTLQNSRGRDLGSPDFSFPGDTGVGREYEPVEDPAFFMDSLASLPEQTRSNKCIPGGKLKKKSSSVVGSVDTFPEAVPSV